MYIYIKIVHMHTLQTVNQFGALNMDDGIILIEET